MNAVEMIQILKAQFDLSAKALLLNLEGISETDALEQPSAGNCINWVVGHLVASRQTVLGHLQEEAVWSPEVIHRYDRRSDPIREAADAPATLADLKDAFALSQRRTIRGLERIRLGESKATWPGCAQAIAFLQFHESYHVGQIGLLRRVVGHPGAIE